MVQKALSARSLSDAQGATILTGWIKVLPMFLIVIPGRFWLFFNISTLLNVNSKPSILTFLFFSRNDFQSVVPWWGWVCWSWILHGHLPEPDQLFKHCLPPSRLGHNASRLQRPHDLGYDCSSHVRPGKLGHTSKWTNLRHWLNWFRIDILTMWQIFYSLLSMCCAARGSCTSPVTVGPAKSLSWKLLHGLCFPHIKILKPLL